MDGRSWGTPVPPEGPPAASASAASGTLSAASVKTSRQPTPMRAQTDGRSPARENHVTPLTVDENPACAYKLRCKTGGLGLGSA